MGYPAAAARGRGSRLIGLPPVNSVAPVESGTETSGSTLSVTTGTWLNTPTSYTYKWMQATTSGGVPITTDNPGDPTYPTYVGTSIVGATSSTYVLQAGDVGQQIFCDVTATNSAGSATKASNVTGVIANNFTPANLFAASEVGLWVDPSDFTTLKTNTDGTGAVTAAGDLVKYIADKSGNGFTFTNATGWHLRQTGTSWYLETDGASYFTCSGTLAQVVAADQYEFIIGVNGTSTTDAVAQYSNGAIIGDTGGYININFRKTGYVGHQSGTGGTSGAFVPYVVGSNAVISSRLISATGNGGITVNTLDFTDEVTAGPMASAAETFQLGSQNGAGGPISAALTRVYGLIAHRIPLSTTNHNNAVSWMAGKMPIDLVLQGAWTWYNNPRIIQVGSNFAFGATATSGVIQANNGLVKPTGLYAGIEEDHTNPSFLVRASDSKVLTFNVDAHDGAKVFVTVSTNANDASAWGSTTDITAQLAGANTLGTLTYTNPIQLTGESNSPIYLFFRGSVNGAARAQCYSKSTDGGVTWAQAVKLFTDSGTGRPYLHAIGNGTSRIDFFLSQDNPSQTLTNSLYHCYYSGGNIYKSDGTLVGAIGSAPYTVESLSLVWDGTTVAGAGWNFDIQVSGGQPVVGFIAAPTPGTDLRYRYAKYSGSGAWSSNQICTAGASLFAGEPYYAGGISIDPANANNIYCSRESGGIFDLWKFVTSDGGATWDAGTKLTSSVSGAPAFRPIVIPGANKLGYVVGPYASYTDYHSNIALMAI